MKYTQMQRKNQNMMTIGEYVREQQPKVFTLFLNFRKARVGIDVTNLILTATDLAGRDRYYRSIMQERPKGGRGGLMPGEKEEDLWTKNNCLK